MATEDQRKHIESLFPDIVKIQDEELREKVVYQKKQLVKK